MATIPQKPSESKAKSLDDLVQQQAELRDIATGVGKTSSEKKTKRTATPKTASRPAAKAKIKSKEVKTIETSPVSQMGRPVMGEPLKNTPFNLPVSLVKRIERIAMLSCAGNKSYYVRKEMEASVARAEKELKLPPL